MTFVYRTSRTVVGATFRIGSRPSIEGVEHVPLQGPVLIAANHLSALDSIVIPLVVPRRVAFLSKAEYFRGHGVVARTRKAWLEANGAVPIDRRGDGDATKATLDVALSVLDQGWAMGIYPEGTRSRDGRLYRGRAGAAWLALTSGAPIVPLGLVGTDKVLPVGAHVPRPARVAVRIGPPLDPGDYADYPSASRARKALTSDLMDSIASLSGQVQAHVYNELPPDA